MATLAKLVVKLVTDVSEFEAGMAAASKKLTKIGDEMSKVGDKLTKGVTLPIVAAGAASLKFAADLNDAMDNSNKVFGESAGVIDEWAKSAAKNIGMSKAAATQAAIGFGQFLIALGNTQNKASEMSTALVGLATDIAELNQEDPAKVMDALQSGLAGRAQALKKYGIILDDTTLKSKALAMGIWDGASAFTGAMKSQAAYASIMEQTTKIQGYYAKQTGDFGKSLNTLKAEFENLFAAFGQIALPAVTKFLEALTPILEWFNKLPDSVKTGIIYFLLFAATLGPILSTVGWVISAVGSFAKLFQAGGALAKAGPGMVKLGSGIFKAFSGLPALFARIGPALSGAGGSVGGLLSTLAGLVLPILAIAVAVAVLILTWKAFGKQATETVRMLAEIVKIKLEQAGQSITEFFSRLGKTDWSQVWASAKTSFQQFGDSIGTWLQGAMDSFSQFVSSIVNYDWSSFGPRALVALQQLGTMIGLGLQNLTGMIGQWINQVVTLDWGAIGRAGWQAFVNFGTMVGNVLKSAVGWINQFINGAVAGIITFGTQLVAGIGNSVKNVAVVIGNAIQGALRAVANWAVSFYNAGQRLMTGFLNGIISMTVQIVQTVVQVVQWIIDAIKRMLGIASPSKVTEGIARNMMLGMEQGFYKFSPGPIKASLQATGQMVPVAAASIGGGGGRSVQVNIPGPINIYGDLSESAKESLRLEMRRLFEDEMVATFGGAG